MTTYINTLTLDYPRHAGDIELDPDGDYEVVNWVDPPTTSSTQIAYEDIPVQIDGQWYMKWSIRDLTSEEIAAIEERNATIQQALSTNNYGLIMDLDRLRQEDI